MRDRDQPRRRGKARPGVCPRVDDDALSLAVLNLTVSILCADAGIRALLTAHYRQMQQSPGASDLEYAVVRSSSRLVLSRDRADAFTAVDRGELLLALDQDLIVQLQQRRQDLYFVHAAALDAAGTGFMLVAASGGGKSTTAWALSHHGFRYLSDELGVVDLPTLTVNPFPRAILLKSTPPTPYPLGPGSISTSRGILIRAETVRGGIGRTPVPLRAIFFLRYVASASEPSVRPLTAAEAGARLYPNVLNALAHPEDGLDATIHVAQRATCFELATGDLTKTCALVRRTLDRLAAH
jgi:hypothetical protein